MVIDLSDYDFFALQKFKTLACLKPQHAICFNHPIDTLYDTNIVTQKTEHITTRMATILGLLSLDKKLDYQLNFNVLHAQDAYKLYNDIKISNEKIIIFNPFASQPNRCLSNQQIKDVSRPLLVPHTF